jgi:hypothetical protein
MGTESIRSAAIVTVLAAAFCGIAGACKAASPAVDDGVADDLPDAGVPYADFVVGWTEDGDVMTCAAEAAECTAGVTTCGPVEVLGAPDGATFSLEPSGVIEVALRCSFVLERGDSDSPDLKLWGTFAEGATVQVSVDSMAWSTLGSVTGTDPVLDLAMVGLETARFIRISNRGDAALAIDAIEALR